LFTKQTVHIQYHVPTGSGIHETSKWHASSY